MNHDRVGKRYGLKFVTCGSKSLRGGNLSQEQIIRVILEQKGSHIYKNVMNKIRNGHDHATWISPSVQTILDEHWASIDFQNKRLIAKANRAIDKGVIANGDKKSKNLPQRKQYLQMTPIFYRSMIMTYN
ncbi:hypothetical protein CR513_32510, partial [Mucuna pruriens]